LQILPEITKETMIVNTYKRTNAPVMRANFGTVHLVQSSQFAQRLARVLVWGLFGAVAAMAFLPWQQTSRGVGQVVAFVPQERQQSIQAPVKGVVARIADGLVEGSQVKKGDFILEIQPFAADLREQLEGQLRELTTKLDSENAKSEAYSQNVEGFSDALEFTVSAAQQLVESARAKLESKQKLVAAYDAKELQARLNYDRQNALFQSGIAPAKEIEKLKKEWDVAKSELESVQQDVASLQKELAAKQDELSEKRLVAQTKIDYARAMQEDAKGKAATVRKEIRELEVKLSEMNRLVITAPRDGTIYRMPVYEQGQTIKEGDSILTLVPETTQIAVDLYISGNDMPLVYVGQEVRLQFEGWPAVQIAGWPSLAVGIFSGTVANVDATDNGKGQFRILVTPDEAVNSWPPDRYLRQGVRVNGLVMMQRVSLGYEIWRQLNGFPIIYSDEKPSTEKNKPPKLPK
jgi:multidrug resistance efflux pump